MNSDNPACRRRLAMLGGSTGMIFGILLNLDMLDPDRESTTFLVMFASGLGLALSGIVSGWLSSFSRQNATLALILGPPMVLLIGQIISLESDYAISLAVIGIYGGIVTAFVLYVMATYWVQNPPENNIH